MTTFCAGRGALARARAAAGGTPGARPAFSAAGSAYENTTLVTTHQPTYPATVNAGELAIVTLWGVSSSPSTALSLSGTAQSAGWVQIGSLQKNGDGTEAMIVARRECAGTEDGAAMEGGITGAGNETVSHVHGVIFTVSAANGFKAAPIENVSQAVETGTTVSGPTVAPNNGNRLATSIIGFSDDNISASAFSGGSGTWTERIDIQTSLQTDSTIQVQTSPADTEISGGSFTAAIDTTRLRFAFAIAPDDV